MRKLFTLVLLNFLATTLLLSQSGIIKGRVFNSINNEPVMFANVVIEGTAKGATTDIEGKYERPAAVSAYDEDALQQTRNMD